MAAGSTYTPIATTTLGSAAAGITFSSISGSYTDLYIVISGAIASADNEIRIRFNSDSGSNYSVTNLLAYSGGVVSQRGSNATFSQIAPSGDNTSPAVYRINLNNYSNTTTYKTILTRSDMPSTSYVAANVGLWRSTAAITTVYIFPNGQNWNTGTMATLYGIAAA